MESGSKQVNITMKTLVAISALIGVLSAQTGPLQPYMLGEFQLETSEGFEDFMYQLGVNWFTRKVVIKMSKPAKDLIDLINYLTLFSDCLHTLPHC